MSDGKTTMKLLGFAFEVCLATFNNNQEQVVYSKQAMSTSNKIQQCLNFLTFNRTAQLSTHSLENQGYPFGSIAPYDIDSNFNFIICAAKISQHYKNLIDNPKASMLVFDVFGLHDPQAYPRATVLLEFNLVNEHELNSVAAAYQTRSAHPLERSIAHTFVYFRGTPKRIRWIGGFGDIRWLSGEFYENSRDEVAYDALPAVYHMNLDHQAALQDFLKSIGESCENRLANMTYLDSTGFEIQSSSGHRHSFVFPEQLKSGSQIRTAIIDMLNLVRASF